MQGLLNLVELAPQDRQVASFEDLFDIREGQPEIL